MGGFAWVTLATNDSYSLGALVLAHSLRRAGTKYDLVVLITPGVTQVMRDKLAAVFSLVQEVNVLDSKEEANLALLARPELGITFTKLHCWRLTQYEKCVFVDADALVVRNCDELFEREELSAAPDVGWPDCFNSGVFVFQPSQQTFASITSFAAEKGSFDGGDQGLLNSYFSNWAHKDISKHLPFIYNMCSTATYSYLPAYKQYGENARIIHFIGATKPWLQYFDTETGVVHPPSGCHHLQPLLQLWWNIFCENVHSQLSPVMARSTLAPFWHRFNPSLPVTSTPSFPMYNDSSYDYSYRSEPTKTEYDYNYDDYDKKPADFTEFNDPWEEYMPKSTQIENIVFYQQDYYVQPYYGDIETMEKQHEYHQQDNKQYENQTINYDKDYHRLQKSCHNQVNNYVIQYKNPTYSQSDNSYHNDRAVHEEYRELPGRDDREIYENRENQENHRLQGSFEAFNGELGKGRNETDHHFENRCEEKINYRLHGEFGKNDDDNKINDNIDNSFSSRDHTQTDHPQHSMSNSLNPEPCTDPLHKVAQHNEQSVDSQGHLDTEDAGIAGALAKITLGEPRSTEQVALEEHMRRQSWEQGQIDYMGRDSFENIWKKICNTLNQAPQGEPSPPQEDQESTIEIESTIVSDVTPATKASTPSADEANVQTELTRSSKEPEATPLPQGEEIQTSKPEAEIKIIDSPTMVQDEKNKEIHVEITKLESAESKDKPQGERTTFVVEDTVAEGPVVQDTEIAFEETVALPVQVDIQSVQSTPIVQSEKKTPTSLELGVTAQTFVQISSTAVSESVSSSQSKAEDFIVPSEATTVPKSLDESLKSANESSELILESNSVPIQVVASVLESEPKESVSEDQCPVSEEVISSIVAPVLESVTAVLETVAESKEPEVEIENGDENGNIGKEIKNRFDDAIQSQITATLRETEKEISAAVVKHEGEESMPVIKPEEEESTPCVKPEGEESASVIEEKIEGEPELQVSAKETEAELELEEEPLSAVSESSKSASLTPPDSPSTQGPVRPARTKDPQIPTTPTVTEATPPNSPPIGVEQSFEEAPKTVKKLIKKLVKKAAVPPEENESAEITEGDVPGKKIVKKVVKKVVKKPKESTDNENAAAETSATGTGSDEKPKKVVKIVKKIIKPSKSLEVDNSVPETPPAGVPVPPKRKIKTTTMKVTTTTTTSKKSPAENDKPE